MKSRPAHGNQLLVGRRLRASRKALSLSQSQAADALNTSSSAVSMWESGDRLLDVTKASHFADRYGLTLDWLFRGQLAGVRSDLVGPLVEELGKLEQASRELAATPERAAKPTSPKAKTPPRLIHRRA